MPYQTDERLKNYLDTNQLHREQMSLAILSIDKRFSEVRPRHPRGGRDGGRDIEAIYRGKYVAYGAIGFLNQANDSKENKKAIKKKFNSDLTSAISLERIPEFFIFITNINLSIKEKEELVSKAKRSGLLDCEIFDRERLRIALDSPDGFSIRFQYLKIPLSEAEQATFFARWGDDIQSVISTGFQRIESALDRILFLQEATEQLHLTIKFEFDRQYSSEEFDHFRLFCSVLFIRNMISKEIFSILFGCSDKHDRINKGADTKQPNGIKYGISGGQWDISSEEDNDNLTNNLVGSYSSAGKKVVDFISISYNKNTFIKLTPTPEQTLTMMDTDGALFTIFTNKSTSEKIKTIHVYANEYKIKEINRNDFVVTESDRDIVPVVFSDEELSDTWVMIRPESSSGFSIYFSKQTPKRINLLP
ncbi:MAG: hypothetical protein D3903_14605 [Candidatus Electrothrix sp. GM3_4]|nr:hypothetical protein [Candidatus Electrothrix sp. GM3_4]